MPIIISKEGGDAKRIERTTFEREEELQEYIFENPDAIPLDDIKENIQFIILTREFPVDVGSIDALGVDSDGDIYIIETKLYKNSNKRNVLSQVIDYGASLWNTFENGDEFINVLARRIKDKNGNDLFELLEETLGASEEIIENMKQNLEDGFYRFIILMDEVTPTLKNLILYINQNSKFSVYSVELEYYQYENIDILRPDIFGTEIKKKTTTSGRKYWDEDSFFKEVEENLDKETIEAIRKLYKYSKENADEISWGTGVATGSFNPKFQNISVRSIYTVWTNGNLEINFGWLNDDDKTLKWRENLHKNLREFESIKNHIPEKITNHQSIPPEDWTPFVDEIIEILDELL